MAISRSFESMKNVVPIHAGPGIVPTHPSVLSRKSMEQIADAERSSDRRRNAHAHGTADTPADPHRGRTRHAGALGTPTDDRPRPRRARALGARVRRRQAEYRRRARIAPDQADRRHGAPALSRPAPRRVAR